MDFAAPTRKTNRYCKFIGETCLFDHSERVSLHRAFSKLKDKYLTMNTFHMFHRRRNSLEFRILEGTKDFRLVENWINLIFHFVDRCRLSPPPESYVWSDPEDFFKFMEFSEEKSDLRLWFLDRLVKNTSGNRRKGILERYVLLREFGQKA
jgi:hypothetical protein